MQTKWSQESQVSVMICDTEGIILSMNDKAAKVFKKSGGLDLIGKNVMDCHPEYAQKKIHELINNNQSNCYTVEKDGRKTLLFQTPWYENGKLMGLVDFIFEVPSEIPNHHRD